MIRRAIASLALLVAAACGGSTKTPAKVALPVAAIDTLPGGIVRVKNTGGTAWTDTNGWKWIAGPVIAPAEGSDGELGEIDGLLIDDAGTVYAKQKKPATIKVFGFDGAYLRSIGTEGDGPGEIRDGYMGLRGDMLLFQDPGHSRLSFFRTDGTFVRAVPSACCYFWPRLTVDSAGRAWLPGQARDNEGGWIRYTLDGTVLDTLRMPPQVDIAKQKTWRVTVSRGATKMSMIMPVPMQPGTSFEPRVDGMVVGGTNDAYRFVIFRNGVDTARIVEAEAPTLPMTVEQRDSVYAEALGNPSGDYRKALEASTKKEDIPMQWLPWTSMSLDGAGRLWVGLPGAKGGVSRLQVFDRDGRLLGDVPPPHPKMFRNGAWGVDRLAVPDEDADGRAIIRTYRLQTTVKP